MPAVLMNAVWEKLKGHVTEDELAKIETRMSEAIGDALLNSEDLFQQLKRKYGA